MTFDLTKEKQDYTQAFYELMLSVLTSSGGNLDLSAPRLNLVGMVRLKVDEYQPQQEGLRFINTGKISNVLDAYINALLDESAKHLIQLVPVGILEPVDGTEADVSAISNNLYGRIVLPEDFIRMVSLRMKSWATDLTDLLPQDHYLYKRQRFPASRGGVNKPKAFTGSIRVDNGAAVAQQETVTLSGTSGTANISCAGLSATATFNGTLQQTVTDFVATYAAAFAAEGVTLTGNSLTLTFTASVAGVAFAKPWISNISGDLTGTAATVQENVPRYETKRTIEYFSVATTGDHVIEKFMYIGLKGAEFIQENLHDALTWLCASKVLNVMGNAAGQANSGQAAMEQFTLSFTNIQ